MIVLPARNLAAQPGHAVLISFNYLTKRSGGAAAENLPTPARFAGKPPVNTVLQ